MLPHLLGDRGSEADGNRVTDLLGDLDLPATEKAGKLFATFRRGGRDLGSLNDLIDDYLVRLTNQ